MAFDLDQFIERAAIREYDGGQSRFAAETAAAQEQGIARWQALQIIKDPGHADRGGPAVGNGHRADALDGRRDADPLPGMQRGAEEKARSVPVGQPEARRDRGALLALRGEHGAEVSR